LYSVYEVFVWTLVWKKRGTKT